MILVMLQVLSPVQNARALVTTWRRAPYRQILRGAMMADTESRELLSFWFDDEARERWFGQPVARFDRAVTERWGQALIETTDGMTVDKVVDWAETATSREAVLAHVILWDQIARHVARSETRICPKRYGPLAVAAARYILENDDTCDNWTAKEQVFMLMPLRHTFDAHVLEHDVLPRAQRWSSGSEKADTSLWRRFIEATIKALVKEGSAERREPTAKTRFHISEFSQVLQAPIPKLMETEQAWDQRYNFHDQKKLRSGGAVTAVYREVRRFLIEHKAFGDERKRLVVSLSGGVDSMLLLYLSWRILHEDPPLKIDQKASIVAVHVDYGNREMSMREAQFVTEYCSWLGVPLFLRSLGQDLRRGDGVVERAAYEEITRQARFDAYLQASEDHEDFTVLLGHNRDDTWENLFTNLEKRRNYNELRGMEAVSTERGIVTWRPLLRVSKKEIYDGAFAFGVPHCQDSTSPDCDRGILRDDWLPAVKEKRPLLLPGLEQLADHLAFLHTAWTTQLDHYWLKEVTKTSVDDTLVFSLPLSQPWFFAFDDHQERTDASKQEKSSPMLWIDIFNRIMAESSCSRPTNRALSNLHDWLRRSRTKQRSSSCELNRDLRAVYTPVSAQNKGNDVPVSSACDSLSIIVKNHHNAEASCGGYS